MTRPIAGYKALERAHVYPSPDSSVYKVTSTDITYKKGDKLKLIYVYEWIKEMVRKHKKQYTAQRADSFQF